MYSQATETIREVGEELEDFAARLLEYAQILQTDPGAAREHLGGLGTLQDQLRGWVTGLDGVRRLLDGSWRDWAPAD